MIKIDTGSNLIARYDEVVPESFCEAVIDYIHKEKPLDKIITEGMPWHNSDSIPFVSIKDQKLRGLVDSYRFLLTQLVHDTFDDIVYPHFSDIVVWRKNMEMDFHKDNGYEGEDQNVFRMRKYSMVLYLNDNYLGGETVIRQENKPDYVSVPKQGSVVIFKSNDECIHGVNKIIKGTRYTLATWFADDVQHCESIDGRT